MEKSKVKKVRYIGQIPVMDITVNSEEHLFYANGIATSNCAAHAKAYSVYSAMQTWLQEHYFLEYMSVLLTHVDRAKEKKGISMLDERVRYCISKGVSILYPDVTQSGKKWEIVGGALLAPLSNIKGFGDNDTEIVERNRPYSSIRDFLDKTNMGKGKFESLLFSNALSKFGDIETLYNWYYNDYTNKSKKESTSSFFDFGDEFDARPNVELHHFDKLELEDKCFEYNGFVVDENLLIKYHDVYEKKLKWFIEDSKELIYTINEAVNSCTGTTWVLAKVKGKQKIKSKYGSDCFVLDLTDGQDYLTIRQYGFLDSRFERGNVLVFPIYWGDKNAEVRKPKISTTETDKKDIFRLE